MELNQPQQPVPADQEAVPVNLSHAVAPGPTGRPWVQLHIQVGLVQTVIMLPYKTVEELAQVLPDFLRGAAGQAKLANSGLIIGEGVQASMKAMNGHGAQP